MEAGSAAYRLYVGVDVAAETFVAAWLAPGGQPSAPITGEQTPTGFATLQRRLQATGSPPAATLVVLEATGNYWVALAVALHEAGFPVSVINPRQALYRLLRPSARLTAISVGAYMATRSVESGAAE